jgi:hypothetical protein
MNKQITFFLLVLSILFVLRYFSELLIKLIQEEPKPMKLTVFTEIFLYLSIAYIATFLIL